MHKAADIKLTVAGGGGGIPLLGGIAEKGFLSYQVEAPDTKVSPQDLSFHLLCKKNAIVHWGKCCTALCWKEKENRSLGTSCAVVRTVHC